MSYGIFFPLFKLRFCANKNLCTVCKMTWQKLFMLRINENEQFKCFVQCAKMRVAVFFKTTTIHIQLTPNDMFNVNDFMIWISHFKCASLFLFVLSLYSLSAVRTHHTKIHKKTHPFRHTMIVTKIFIKTEFQDLSGLNKIIIIYACSYLHQSLN